jgi:DNA-binding MarR family transcriptional regulator
MTDNNLNYQDNSALVRELSVAIRRFRSRLRTESKSNKSTSTIAQSDVISRIIENGPITIKDLAEFSHVRPQSMAEIVGDLKSEGFILSKVSPFDRRKVLLSPTAKGKKRVKSVYSTRAWLGKVMSKELDSEEIETLARAVKILERLADYQDNKN